MSHLAALQRRLHPYRETWIPYTFTEEFLQSVIFHDARKMADKEHYKNKKDSWGSACSDGVPRVAQYRELRPHECPFVLGLLGEHAVGQHLGLEVDREISRRGKLRPDFPCGIGVKTNTSRELLVKTDKVCARFEVAAWHTKQATPLGHPERGRVWLVGWSTRPPIVGADVEGLRMIPGSRLKAILAPDQEYNVDPSGWRKQRGTDHMNWAKSYADLNPDFSALGEIVGAPRVLHRTPCR